MIAEYLNADRETAIALKDEWGIADILRAVDRRIGRRQWDGLLENINPKVSNAVGKIISSRKISRKSQIENEIIGKEGDGRKTSLKNKEFFFILKISILKFCIEKI